MVVRFDVEMCWFGKEEEREGGKRFVCFQNKEHFFFLLSSVDWG